LLLHGLLLAMACGFFVLVYFLFAFSAFASSRIQNMKIIDGKPEYKGALVSSTCV